MTAHYTAAPQETDFPESTPTYGTTIDYGYGTFRPNGEFTSALTPQHRTDPKFTIDAVPHYYE